MATAVLLAPLAARGQTASEVEPGVASGGASDASSGWRLYPREKHLLVRVMGGAAARLNDPFGVGRLAPPTLTVDAAFTLAHIGRFQIGPYLGFQVGFDRNGAQPQYAVVPGAVLTRRFSDLFGFNVRVGVPIAIVRGNCDPFPIPAQGYTGRGSVMNRGVVQVPDTSFCPTVSPGIEAAVGAALYLRSGFALTAEVNFDLYFGDNNIAYPFIGGSLGFLFDYEVIP